MTTEEGTKQEEQKLITDGGYEYMLTPEGLKIRASIAPERLISDNETYDEYKIRRRLVQKIERGKIVWFSKEWGTNNATNRKKVYDALIEYTSKLTEEENKKNV